MSEDTSVDVSIPLPDDNKKDDEIMSELHEQNMGQIAQLGVQLQQTGIVAQNNFVTAQKLLELDFLEQRRMITLEEGVGVREVASKQVPAGPTSIDK